MAVPLFGMCTVCNEEDILAECLRHAAAFHDKIYVVDCGSDDHSAEIARDLADELSPVEYLGAIGPHHSRQVKRHIWERFRHDLPPGAWWSVLDADEFFDEDPRPALARATAEGADHAFASLANFYYKRSELEDWRAGRETLADRARPIAERRHWYRMHVVQFRFIRQLSRLRWLTDSHLPLVLARGARELIPARHYQYRDPEQILQRLKTRQRWLQAADIKADNPHWYRTELEEVCSDDEDPHLLWHEPGQPLVLDPEAKNPSPVRPAWRQALVNLYASTRYALTPQPSSNEFWKKATF